MNAFSTPREARTYIVSSILERATRECITFDDFERRLLAGSATDNEIEDYEEREDAEDLWAKVSLLAEKELHEDRLSRDEFRNAIQLSASDPEYIDGILHFEGLAGPSLRARVKRGIWRWLWLGLVCILGGLCLAFVLPYLFDLTERLGSSHGVKTSFRLIERYGAAFMVALIVTTLIWSLQQLRRR